MHLVLFAASGWHLDLLPLGSEKAWAAATSLLYNSFLTGRQGQAVALATVATMPQSTDSKPGEVDFYGSWKQQLLLHSDKSPLATGHLSFYGRPITP